MRAVSGRVLVIYFKHSFVQKKKWDASKRQEERNLINSKTVLCKWWEALSSTAQTLVGVQRATALNFEPPKKQAALVLSSAWLNHHERTSFIHSYIISAFYQQGEIFPTMAPILFPLIAGMNFAFLYSSRVACDSDKATSDGLALLPACMKTIIWRTLL